MPLPLTPGGRFRNIQEQSSTTKTMFKLVAGNSGSHQEPPTPLMSPIPFFDSMESEKDLQNQELIFPQWVTGELDQTNRNASTAIAIETVPSNQRLYGEGVMTASKNNPTPKHTNEDNTVKWEVSKTPIAVEVYDEGGLETLLSLRDIPNFSCERDTSTNAKMRCIQSIESIERCDVENLEKVHQEYERQEGTRQFNSGLIDIASMASAKTHIVTEIASKIAGKSAMHQSVFRKGRNRTCKSRKKKLTLVKCAPPLQADGYFARSQTAHDLNNVLEQVEEIDSLPHVQAAIIQMASQFSTTMTDMRVSQESKEAILSKLVLILEEKFVRLRPVQDCQLVLGQMNAELETIEWDTVDKKISTCKLHNISNESTEEKEALTNQLSKSLEESHVKTTAKITASVKLEDTVTNSGDTDFIPWGIGLGALAITIAVGVFAPTRNRIRK